MEKVKVRTVYPENPIDNYEDWMSHIRKNLVILRQQIELYERQEASRRDALRRTQDSTHGVHSQEQPRVH